MRPTLLLALLFTTISFSQITIWEEDFSAYADETTIGTANRWTITTTPGINLVPATNNHFWTLLNEFHARNTLGLEQVFTSEIISISAFSNIDVTIDVTESGNNQNVDYVNVYYKLNGGIETLFATNGQNNANFTAQVAQQTGLNGGTLQLVIRAANDSNGAQHAFDNILVQGVSAITPGAVEAGLQLWMRADAGIDATEAIQNTEVTSWTDQSTNGYIAAKEVNGPEYKENSINFNPTLRFQRGQNTFFNLGQPANLDIRVGAGAPSRSDITVFAAFLTDGAGAGTLLAKGNNNVRSYQLWLGDIDRVTHYTWGRDQENASFDSRNWGDIHGRNEPKITTGTVNVSGYKSYVNNIEDNMVFDLGVGDGFATTDVMIGARRNGNGSSNTGAGNRLTGNVAEIIVYDRELNSFEIQKVNSYLAIKYGITLGYNDEIYVADNSPQTTGTGYSGTSNDYIASNGSPLWIGSANAGFGYNVFGIARDDNSNLHQIKSQSSNVQRIEISPGNATFLDAILTIENIAGALDDDLSYLLVGHNGQDISLQSSALPVRTNNLLNRIWKSRESNTDTGETDLTFDMTQYLGIIPNPEDLHLYIADNTSFTGYCNYQGTFNTANDRLKFTGINLGENIYFTLGIPTEISGDQDIFFDGVQSHVSAPRMLGGEDRAAIMAWIKPDAGFTSQGIIVGEEAFYIYLNGNMVPGVSIVTDTGDFVTRDGLFSDTIQSGEWAHIAATFNAGNGKLELYLNGKEIGDLGNPASFTGTALSTTIGTEFSQFAIGKNGAEFGTQYFFGDIDEVRVFDRAYKNERLQQMIFQEIQDNAGFVRGTIIPKDISTDGTDMINWNRLMAYYPMSSVKGNIVFDASSNTVQGKLNDVGNDIKAQTAPLPFTTNTNGDLTNASSFTNGTIWNINNLIDLDWSILKVSSNVTINDSMKNLGLFVETADTLRINGDNDLNNTWYLELNGILDLQGDSQLIQSDKSDLVTSATGKILRRQEGNTDIFWYNYWTSPVGTLGATTLSDNNTSVNNINNTPFSLNMLEQGNGANVNFTTTVSPPLTNPVTLSSRWFYNFQNGLDYNDWVAMDETTAMIPGMGYTQKGTGAAGLEQQYVFEGKPNNGTILVPADDVDGDSVNESEEGVTMTLSLVGNPYPSALDAVAFINDNAGIIQGTILLWEQWAGNSHNLGAYEGGYGYINTMATARAYQHPDIVIAGQTQTQGIKTPTFFIPVGQGFFVEVVNDGDIEFNNSQRVFKQEALNESIFFDPIEADSDKPFTSEETTNRNSNPSNIDLIRFEFSTSAGATRHFVTGFSDTTTDGFDYGFDGGLITTTPEEDMGVFVDNQHYVLQAFAPITAEKVVDLTFTGSGNYTYSIEMIDIQNIDASQAIYLKDNQENIYWNLRQGAYNFSALAGQDHERFDLVFQPGETLSDDEFNTNDILIYVNNTQDKLFVKGMQEQAKSLSITNMLGQRITTLNNVSVNTLENGVDVSQLASGVYIVDLKTENNKHMSKKLILE